MLQIGEGMNTMCAVSLKCCCVTKAQEIVRMNFRSFYLFFFPAFLPKSSINPDYE